MYLKGAILNETEKILRKKRLAIVVAILTVLQIVAGIIIYTTNDTTTNTTNWEAALQQEISSMESSLPQIPSDQAEQKERMQHELDKKKFQLQNHVNPNPPGAAGDSISSVSAPFITTILPLLMIVIGADLVSGELSDGTMKSILVRPIGRTTILLSKWIAFIVFSVIIMLYSNLLNYIVIAIVSGAGNFNDLIVVDTSSFVTLPIWKFMIIGMGLNLYTIIMLSSVVLLISVLVRSSSVSVSLSMIVIVVGGLFSNLGTKLTWMKFVFLPHLDLVSHLTGSFHLPQVTLMESLLVLFVTGVVSLLVAFVLFTRKDMLI
jgi:ABC-2 type transport system permease protein